LSNLSKDTMKRLLILGYLPFVVVLVNSIDWGFLRLNPELKKRECVVYHENAPVHLKCQTE
jgi:hypothetical protein